SNYNLLKWAVADEFATEVHLIERSTDGKTFTEIGKLIPSEQQVNSYHWKDESPISSAYYRIQVIDNDQTVTFSSTILLVRPTKETFAIENLFPIPEKNLVTIAFNAPTASGLQVTVFDLTGRLVVQQEHWTEIGQQQLELQTGALVSGTYLVRLVHSDGSYATRKFIIKQ
ncbi:MAG: T9SS type A sorting domain-containing protein, partial [Saprospiraceae bacterium]